MANKITAVVLGGNPVVLDDVETIGDVKARLSVTRHTATVNGEPAENDFELEDFEFVSLSPSVKGGR